MKIFMLLLNYMQLIACLKLRICAACSYKDSNECTVLYILYITLKINSHTSIQFIFFRDFTNKFSKIFNFFVNSTTK